MSQSQIFTQILQEWSEVFMHRSFRDFKRFMDDSGLSASQVNAMMRLYYHGSSGVTDVAQSLEITNAAASQLVDKLVSRRLINRKEDVHDRRVKLITLTEQGRDLIRAGITARRRWMEDLTTTLSDKDQEAIVAALTLLTEAARRLETRNISKHPMGTSVAGGEIIADTG